MENVKKEIIKEAERIRIDCVYKVNVHFKIAAFWSKLKFFLEIPITVLAAITSGLALSNYHEVAGYFALIVSILSAITTFLEPTEKKCTF
ncbi:SLATT domain-containing protein [Pelotomaculum propionicicum]|uniref:SLATT domain-containing protein n=1 Tax=Pelotomaculum propionicicum TaxID=258475 RepID=UPI003B792754